MSLALKCAIRGDVAGYMQGQKKAALTVATQVNRRAGRRTRRMLQNAIRAGFRKNKNRQAGADFAKTIIFKDTPRTGSAIPNMTQVYCVARYAKRRTVMIDLLTVFTEGADIRPTRGKWLAIPTPFAYQKVHKRGGYVSPEMIPNKHFVQKQANLAFFFDNASNQLLFVLVPFIKIRPRINAHAIHTASSAKMRADYTELMARETAKLIQKFSA